MKRVSLVLIILILFSCKESKNDKTNDETDIISEISGDKNNALTQKVKQIEVLTLGSFHFNFPNLDINQTGEEDQIDVLSPIHQTEIEAIVDKLERFKPTIIVIERHPKFQNKYDSLYTAYLNGNHTLTRSEEQQIGFRLAKRLGLKRLNCADVFGRIYENINKVVFQGEDTIAQNKFNDYFYNNPDTLLNSWNNKTEIFKTHGILEELKRLNTDNNLKESLGDYLIGIFKYETEENNLYGADFTTGWWFNRNLRIFRNIQKIPATPEDRILVIFGAGHMNLLNIFFDSSPEYNLNKVNDYLN